MPRPIRVTGRLPPKALTRTIGQLPQIFAKSLLVSAYYSRCRLRAMTISPAGKTTISDAWRPPYRRRPERAPKSAAQDRQETEEGQRQGPPRIRKHVRGGYRLPRDNTGRQTTMGQRGNQTLHRTQRIDFAVRRETACGFLRIRQTPIDGNLERAAPALHQFDLRLELFDQPIPRTAGLGFIVSGYAVFDLNLHPPYLHYVARGAALAGQRRMLHSCSLAHAISRFRNNHVNCGHRSG